MKIAFFHELTPLSGARKVVEEYAKILRSGHEVDLYYVDERKDVGISDILSNTYYFEFKQSGPRILRDTLDLIRLFLLHKQIALKLKSKGYDLVVVSPSRYTQAPFLLSFVKNAVYFCQEPLRIVYDPLMAIPQGLNLINKVYETLNRKVRKLIDRHNIKCAKLVLANSEFSKQTIAKAYGINAKVCYLGVDIKNFSPKSVNKLYDLIFIGAKSSIDGYYLLIETLKLFKKLSVGYVVRGNRGEGISEQELAVEMNRSKIVVALSKGEPFGLMPVEAMACGVPVIAVAEGGLKESVVDGRTGFLIKRDKVELKSKIELLLKDDILRNQLGKNARELVLAKFTWEESVNRFLKICSQ